MGDTATQKMTAEMCQAADKMTDEDGFIETATKNYKDRLNLLYRFKRPSIVSPSRLEMKADFALKKRIVWYEISERNGLIYELNSRELGTYFIDGTMLIQTGPL